jgi:hypothetical protein
MPSRAPPKNWRYQKIGEGFLRPQLANDWREFQQQRMGFPGLANFLGANQTAATGTRANQKIGRASIGWKPNVPLLPR